MGINNIEHILRSRAPLAEEDKKSEFPKPVRTQSFSKYEPDSRDSMAELVDAIRSKDNADAENSKHENTGFRLQLLKPYQSISLRPLRRTDALRLQVLMTEKVTSHLGNEILEKHNDFCSAVKYMEDLLEKDWIPIDRESSDEVHLTNSTTTSLQKSKKTAPSRFVIAENDILIGMMSIWGVEDDRNLYHAGELMYWLGEPYWNRGIMSAVASFFLDWCWKTFWWLNRIDAGVYITWNPYSQRILSKLGMKYEGCLRKPIWQKDKGYSDIEIWSQMREEWEARQDGNC